MNNGERELLTAAVKGDKRAFCRLITLHRAKLRSFAVNITGNPVLADDILQEALIKAFQSIGNFEIRGVFTTWLWRIIKNEFINYLRDPANRIDTVSISANEKDIDIPDPDMNEETLLKKEIKDKVRTLVSALPLKLRSAIILVDLEEMSYDEAADILEISLTALKARVFKGRRKLIEFVKMNPEIKQLSSDQFRISNEEEED